MFIQYLFQPEGQLLFVSVVLTVVISIVLHELAHGWAALWQGDDTPRTSGHMTPDPLVHMGGMSLLALVLVGIAWGMMPVNPNRFRSRYGDALVAAAGPAMNVALALVSLTGLALWSRAVGPIEQSTGLGNLQFFLQIFGTWNIALALFNLAPIPPLDGSAVLGNFSPSYKRWLGNLQNPESLFFAYFFFMMILSSQGHGIFDVAMRATETYLRIW